MSTSVVVEKLSGFLQQGPTDFEITILPTATTNVESKMLSIDDSIVLVDGKHLGLDARSLPWITREIRRDYKRIKQQQLQHPLCTTTNNPELLLQVTSCLLLVNPDHATAWADRRRCTLTLTQNEKEDTQNVTDKGDHTYWHQELKFLNLLMTQHSKAPSSWGHRKYILGKILLTTLTDTLLISQHSSQNDGNDQQAFSWQALARNEIVTCTQVAERYPKNYYAWTHRRYLWTVLLRTQPAQSQLTQHLKVLWRQELESIFTWFQRHVSDHSAAHYGAQVLELYLRYSSEDDEDDEDIAQLAIRKIRELFQIVGNEHETLWSFRRMVVRVLMLSNHQQHQALVKEEIQSVYQQYTMTVPRMGEAADFTTTNIYAWTFLLWCVVHFPDWSTVGKNQISSEAIPILQNHPNISHQMWKTHINTIVTSAIACDSNLHH